MVNRTKLHFIGNAHLDPVWLWQWQEGFQEVKATFRSALDRMNEFPDFIFTSSSAVYYEWVENNHADMFAEIKARIAEGRWVICGGWWLQPDCNLPSGESFVRQGLYGQRYFQEKFGVTARVGYNVDSFGHHAMLPQILKKSGMDSYVFMRPEAHEWAYSNHLFWWESDDGSRVMAYRLPFGYNSIGDDMADKTNIFKQELLKEDNHELMCFYGVGNHGGGPTKATIESIQRLQATDEQTLLLFSSPNRFFDELPKNRDYPVVHYDLQHTASGCYSAHSAVKRWNRQAENLLGAAEKYSTIANLITRQAYPEDLTLAWKGLLFNQFHDIITGTSLPEAYEDARDLYGEVKTIAARAYNYAVQSLAWNIHIEPEEGMTPIVVFNPHAWFAKRNVEMEFGHPGWVGDSKLLGTEILLDEQGREVPYQSVQSHTSVDFRSRITFSAELPSLGYRVYRMFKQQEHHKHINAAIDTRNSSLSANETILENRRFRLQINPLSGCIASLYDKQCEVEVFNNEAAVPVVLEDSSNTWSHNVFHFDKIIGAFKVVNIHLVSSGPVKAVIRVESEYGRSRLTQEFIMYAELDQIDVDVTVDWQEQFKMLKLQFPVQFNDSVGTYEIPYGHIERPFNGEEEPGLNWVDISGESSGEKYGFSLLNDCKYSFDMRDSVLSLTVLRSTIHAYYYHFAPFERKENERYAFMDQGVQSFRYSMLPHAGDWKQAGTIKRAAELNQRPAAVIETYHAGSLPQSASYLSVDRDNIVVSVIKKAEDNNDIIIRCYETNKEHGKAIIDISALNRRFEADFGPCEIKTFRVPADHNEPIAETNLLEW